MWFRGTFKHRVGWREERQTHPITATTLLMGRLTARRDYASPIRW
jgi:hypothetical protein